MCGAKYALLIPFLHQQEDSRMSTLEFSQLLGNYGEFVGAIGVVVTLMYLVIQNTGMQSLSKIK